jgi:hypothetical protein
MKNTKMDHAYDIYRAYQLDEPFKCALLTN